MKIELWHLRRVLMLRSLSAVLGYEKTAVSNINCLDAKSFFRKLKILNCYST